MLDEFKKQFKEKGEIYLRVKVRPNVSENKIKEILEDSTIKIDITAKPEKNKANNEVIKFLSKEFGVLKNNVKIISGSKDKVKLIKIII